MTLSGNDASVVLAECIAGTEEAFANVMNENAKRLGLTNSHFGNSNGWPDEGRTYVTARDLATLARAEIENHPDLYKQFYSKTEFTWGKTMGSGANITQGNRNPLLGRVAGADGLKTGHTEEAGYGFTGSAEQNGRRLIMVVAGLDSFTERIDESVRLMQWGFNAWQSKPLFKAGTNVGSAKVQLGSSSEVPLVAPRDLAVTIPAGMLSKTGAMKIRYQGPVKAPIAKGQHVADLVVSMPDGRAGDAAGRGRSGRAGWFLRTCLDRLAAAHRIGVSARGRFITLEGGEGVGKSTQLKALAQALRDRGIDLVVTREPGGSDGAEKIRELLLTGDEDRWSPQAEALLFAAARTDHVDKMIQPRGPSGQVGAFRPVHRQLAGLSGRRGRARDRGRAGDQRLRNRGMVSRSHPRSRSGRRRGPCPRTRQ